MAVMLNWRKKTIFFLKKNQTMTNTHERVRDPQPIKLEEKEILRKWNVV